MPARPGRLQAAFSAGEIDRMLDARTEQKAYNGGLRWAENIEFVPQGGFTLAPRPVHVGDLPASAARLFPFTANDGSAEMIVAADGVFRVWADGAEVATLATPYDSAMLAELDFCQQLDTAFFWHKTVKPRRVLRDGPASWTIDEAPLEHIPTYDYGEAYTNGVPAEWEIQLIGFEPDTVFFLTVSNQDTASLQLQYESGGGTASGPLTAAAIEAALSALPNVAPGLTVASDTSDNKKYTITFGGDDNVGDDWAVSGTVVNKSDAAVVSFHNVIGVTPGEEVISDTRGWPRTGAFYNQRLLMAGFSSLPNAWMYSIEGNYYNFDDRLDEANGSALVPMDVPGGEAIVKLFSGRNLLIYTTAAEYWLSDRAISKLTAPNHVLASSYGSRPGLPVVENEGAALHIQKDGNVICECRYTDVAGNYETRSISLIGAHLFEAVRTQAIQRAATRGSANRYWAVRDDGAIRTGTILREQEITAFGRWSTDGLVRDVAVDGDNVAFLITERSRGTSTVRALERLDASALLDAAVTVAFDPAATAVTGLDLHEGREVWAIADDDVFGPFTVSGGTIELPRAVASVTVGRWSPPAVETLPLSGLVAEGVWLAKKVRIHTVRLSLEDTTSVAVASGFVKSSPDQSPLEAAAGRIRSVPLGRWNMAARGELAKGFTGWVSASGLKGFVDDPTVLVTQLRPGRLTVKAIIIEATRA